MKRCVTISPLDLLLGFLALVSVLVYVGVAARLDEVGYPLDDAWIHQTYARNLARTGQWAFVPGQVSSASTAPCIPSCSYLPTAWGFRTFSGHLAWELGRCGWLVVSMPVWAESYGQECLAYACGRAF